MTKLKTLLSMIYQDTFNVRPMYMHGLSFAQNIGAATVQYGTILSGGRRIQEDQIHTKARNV